MAAIKKLAHSVVKGIAELELPADYFEENHTHDPTCKLSIINYRPDIEANKQTDLRWGVGEHTDYGLLTTSKQDDSGDLQAKPHNKERTAKRLRIVCLQFERHDPDSDEWLVSNHST